MSYLCGWGMEVNEVSYSSKAVCGLNIGILFLLKYSAFALSLLIFKVCMFSYTEIKNGVFLLSFVTHAH